MNEKLQDLQDRKRQDKQDIDPSCPAACDPANPVIFIVDEKGLC
jgi:hypothetical protein